MSVRISLLHRCMLVFVALLLTLSYAFGAAGPAQAGTIPVITISADPLTISKTNRETTTITVSSNVVVATDVLVYVAYTGTAVYNQDYLTLDTTPQATTPKTDVITIAKNTSSVTYTLEALKTANNQNVTLTLDHVVGTGNIGAEDTVDIQLVEEPTISISPASTTISESAGKATLDVNLSSPWSLGPVTVNLSYTGTAALGVDYSVDANPSSSITIPTGQTTAQVTLTAIPDTIKDGNETATVAISAQGIGTVDPNNDTANVIINDTTAAGVLTISANAAQIHESSGTTQTKVMVTTNVTSKSNIVVGLNYTGSATTGDDYTTDNPTTVTIPANQKSATFTVYGKLDDIVEGNETINIALQGSPSGWSIDPQKASVALDLVDDTKPGTVSIAANPINISENGGKSTVTVTSTVYYSQDVTVTLKYEGADQGVNFTAPTTLVIPAGQITGTITLTAIDNKVYNPTLTVTVSIASVSGGTIGTGSAVNVGIFDSTAPGLEVTTTGPLPLPVPERSSAGVPVKVRLVSAPKVGTTVTVTLTTGDPSVSKVTPDTLNFDANNWGAYQTVQVQGVSNGQCKLVNYNITITAKGSDGKYNDTKTVAATNGERCVYLPALTLSSIVYSDSFDGTKPWTMMPETGTTSAQINNEMVVKHVRPSRNVRVVAQSAIAFPAGGFSASVVANKAGTGEAEYGMIFDYKQSATGTLTYYRYLVNPVDRSYRFEQLTCTPACARTTLATSASSAVDASANGQNVLKVEWAGSMLKLYINNALVSTLPGYTYSNGQVGLIIVTPTSTSASLPAEAHFRAYQVVQLP